MRRLLVPSLLALTLAAGAGAALADGSMSNLLAEVGGVALGSLLTVALLERYLAHERERAWQGLRTATYDVLASTVHSAFYEVSFAAHDWGIRGQSGIIVISPIGRLENYLEEARGLIAALNEAKAGELHATAWAAVEDDVEVFRREADRLISLGSEPELARLLVVVETRAAALKEFARFEEPGDVTVSRENGLPFSMTGWFLETVLDVYEYVVERRPPLSSRMAGVDLL